MLQCCYMYMISTAVLIPAVLVCSLRGLGSLDFSLPQTKLGLIAAINDKTCS